MRVIKLGMLRVFSSNRFLDEMAGFILKALGQIENKRNVAEKFKDLCSIPDRLTKLEKKVEKLFEDDRCPKD